ncbi:hypothetical protein C8035_v004535 [Colletotrichum spinosum]|uniref:Uncharacterized protein n=1 Tax=Colletotrichum spinosum TaxID=1347390 RepID=A0A4R8PUI6_9PEZI|nr:hypothetical protein C8035_v004535 [Colletotrichum spinosum]
MLDQTTKSRASRHARRTENFASAQPTEDARTCSTSTPAGKDEQIEATEADKALISPRIDQITREDGDWRFHCELVSEGFQKRIFERLDKRSEVTEAKVELMHMEIEGSQKYMKALEKRLDAAEQCNEELKKRTEEAENRANDMMSGMHRLWGL